VNVRATLSNPRAIIGASILVFFIVVAALAPVISPYSPTDISFAVGLGPSWNHWFGTTEGGQDILSQLIWGTRASVSVGLLTGALICLVQLVMGVFAGYVGGLTDTSLATVTNVFLVLPALPLLIVLSAYLQGSGGSGSTPVLIGVITVTGWAWGARVLRSQAIALRDRPFVEAARISGEGRWHIVLSHIVPNMLGIMVANFFGAALFAVLAEAGLEFIGLGNINTVTWGTMLYWAQNDEATLMGLWMWLLVPGLCILLFGTALGLLNFAVDEIANPSLRRD
jgi:peptide/nickel transport system permease protein